MQRIAALDGLRALAAVAVVAFHCKVPLISGGFFGVDLFFVLSGFLITSLLVAETEETGTISLTRFYARRLLRLVPAFALMLAAFALLAPIFFPGANVLAEVLLSGFYVSNASQAYQQVPEITGHTWSLAAEMQFYIVWPLVILSTAALSRTRMISVLALMFVAATGWRFIQYWDTGWDRSYFGPDTHLSGLVLGALCAVIKWRPSPGIGLAVALTGLALLVVLTVTSHFGTARSALGGQTLAELAGAMLIVGVIGGKNVLAAVLASPVMIHLGAWSYAIYLWHYPIARWTREHFDPWISFGITLPLSIALAAASYGLVERPLNRWGARRFHAPVSSPRRRGPNSPHPQATAGPRTHR